MYTLQANESVPFLKKKETLLFFLIFALFLILGYLFPYTHDDWAWGSAIGLERLRSHFANYNGRWLGNLVVLLLTRQRLLRTVIYGLTFPVTIFLANRIAGGKRLWSILLSLAFLLTIPAAMFAQSISWTAGFANYTISLPFLLVILLTVLRHLFAKTKQDVPKYKLIYICMILLCAFSGTLFMEHYTLFLLALAVFANIVFLLKYKRCNLIFLGIFFAVIAGSAIMFSNGAYRAIGNATDFYRQTAVNSGFSGMISAAGQAYFNTIAPQLLLNNILLSLCLGVCGVLLLHKYKPRFRLPALGLLYGFLFYQLFCKWMPFVLHLNRYGKVAEGILCLCFFLSLAYALWCTPALRWKGLFLLGSTATLTAPLLIVSPIGPRNFYGSYLFLSILCLYILNHITSFPQTQSAVRFLCKGAAAISLLFSLLYLCAFTHIGYVDRQRITVAQQQVAAGKSEITLPTLPYDWYMQFSSPANEEFTRRYKYFYALPQEVTLHFIPYDTFQKINVADEKK